MKHGPQQNRFPTRLGKGMIVIAWLLVLGLLTLFFNRWLEQQRNPNQDVKSFVSTDGLQQVVLKRNRSGHYVATGKINGTQVEFLLDTGATLVAVPERLAHYLGLRRGAPMVATTANGRVTAYTTVLDQVELGGIMLRRVRASIMPGMEGAEALLGMSFLKQLELIQRNDTLILRQY